MASWPEALEEILWEYNFGGRTDPGRRCQGKGYIKCQNLAAGGNVAAYRKGYREATLASLFFGVGVLGGPCVW